MVSKLAKGKTSARPRVARNKGTDSATKNLPATKLLSSFKAFAKAKNVALNKRLMTPSLALEAMTSFYKEVRFAGYKPGKTDTLLFQYATSRVANETYIDVTRQLYLGAGYSRQLSLTLVFAIDHLDFRESSSSIWSHKQSKPLAQLIKTIRSMKPYIDPIPKPDHVRLQLAAF